MKKFIGVDPGLGGAVAILYEDGLLEVIDTPVVTVKKARRDYLVPNMATIFDTPDQSPTFAALEQGIPMPRQASNTTYLMGRGGGLWEGIFAALSIPYELVSPQKWKKAMGIPPKSDKGASRMLAARLFPTSAHLFQRVKDDGRAEAVLIAEYRRRLG